MTDVAPVGAVAEHSVPPPCPMRQRSHDRQISRAVIRLDLMDVPFVAARSGLHGR
jgi:hypothetical protein